MELILALAIGVTTAMFTVVDALMLRPVPFRDADRLVRMALRSPGSRGGGYTIFGSVSPAVLAAWRQSPIFTDVQAAHGDTSVVSVSNALAPVERDVAFATPRLFPIESPGFVQTKRLVRRSAPATASAIPTA